EVAADGEVGLEDGGPGEQDLTGCPVVVPAPLDQERRPAEAGCVTTQGGAQDRCGDAGDDEVVLPVAQHLCGARLCARDGHEPGVGQGVVALDGDVTAQPVGVLDDPGDAPA